MYGLNEEEAVEKIKQIETKIRDSVLSETTVVRTKNTITIVSEYPTRHVQIVLRLYKSVSEILTGFDVDCACVAYDGNQVWLAPRALASFCTQINEIDLTRRSASYENRLCKYASRGFEVHWPSLDRSRVDPTIFERAFNRVQGLARLLILEKLPHPQDRDEYLNKRRVEKGRPELPFQSRYLTQLKGNIKDVQPCDIGEFIQDDTISGYSSFTIPWGPRYTAKKIERLLFQQDLLKNAEFNRPKDRETNLHRHPAFFGRVEDVIGDCCGYCPKPGTDADLAAWEEESKIYVSGDISFLKDDPGRQEIGSFHPLTDDDWTEMAYVGSSEILCQAIVDNDLQAVIEWFNNTEGLADVNRRDHTGRTPLQLAVTSSSPEVVQYLIDRGARMVARLYNGMTALHLAAWRGSTEMVRLLLDKSAENQTEQDSREETRKQARRTAAGLNTEIEADADMSEVEVRSDEDDMMEEASDSDSEDRMTGSFFKVEPASEAGFEKENDDDPDVFDVDVLAWDSPCSPLHLAVIGGHLEVITLLVDDYGADVMLPVKLMTNEIPRRPSRAILSLLLPLDLSTKLACKVEALLLERGASLLQASMDQRTAPHQIIALAKLELLKTCKQLKPEAVSKALNRLVVDAQYWSVSVDSPLLSAIRSGSVEVTREVLALGANPVIELEDFVSAYNSSKHLSHRDPDEQRKQYYGKVTQPIVSAARQDAMVDIIIPLLNSGADVNTLTAGSWEFVQESNRRWNIEDKSLLDLVRDRRKELERSIEDSSETKLELKQVEPLNNDDHYLQDFIDGSYQEWSASKDLETAKHIQSQRNKYFTNEFRKQTKGGVSLGKRDAIVALARKYKAVENRLVEEGAKTFYELYPKLKESSKNSQNGNEAEQTDVENIYQTRFKFFGSNVTPSQTQRYIKLFSAAFSGDSEVVRALCLSQSPLEAAVSDHNGFNAFSIALLRGHYELASIILDIVAAQYHDQKALQRKEYSLRPFDSEESDDDNLNDDGPPRFHERLVDDNFTIDDIDAVKDVRSNTTPLQLLNINGYQIWRFMTDTREEALRRCRTGHTFDPNPWAYNSSRDESWSKFRACWDNEVHSTKVPISIYAIICQNVKLFDFLLQAERKYGNQDPQELLRSVMDRKNELKHALNLGRIEIVDLLLRNRGTLLPLQHLADKSGVAIEEIPKFYQGLSVYGKKRKDWTDPEHLSTQNNAETGSPLLDAIMQGNLDVVDYFMSNTPSRRYDEFCVYFGKDLRVRALAESKGGLSATLNTWMGTRINLALHVAVMSWPAGANKMIRHLLTTVPTEYLETYTVDGDTPLHLALKIGNIPGFELLISSGANQRTRDKKGRNLLHTIYSTMIGTKNKNIFVKLISLLDQSLLPTLLTERCSGSGPGLHTPLALHLWETSYGKEEFALLDEMLTLSSGKDLGILNGAGDYPLHVEVRRGMSARAIHLARKRPDLLFLENAIGLTPLEVAATSYLQSRMTVPQNNARKVDILDDSYDVDVQVALTAEERNGDSEVDDNLPQGDVLYSSLVRIMKANPQPRCLIGLLDANETARRLAGRESRNNAEFRRRQAQGLKAHRWYRYYSRNAEDSSQADDTQNGTAKQDEVVQWFNDAQARYSRVPFCEHESADLEVELQRWRDLAEGRTKTIQCCDLANSDNKYVRQEHKRMTDIINDQLQS